MHVCEVLLWEIPIAAALVLVPDHLTLSSESRVLTVCGLTPLPLRC